jgi:hypothetical protein
VRCDFVEAQTHEAKLLDSDSVTGNASDMTSLYEQRNTQKKKYFEETIEKCHKIKDLLSFLLLLQTRKEIEILR